MVTRTRHDVTLYLHCLSCSLSFHLFDIISVYHRMTWKNNSLSFIRCAFPKLGKASICFVTYVHPPVCPSVHKEQLGSHWKYFREILHLSTFRKAVEKNQVSLKYEKNNGTLQEDQNAFLIIARLIFLGMRNISDKSRRKQRITQFMVIDFFFRKSCRLR